MGGLGRWRIGWAALLAAILGLTVSAAIAPARLVTAAERIQGDADCDGVIAIADPLAIAAYVAGLGPQSDCLEDTSDTNCDGGVDQLDALRALRFLVGLGNDPISGCTAIGEPLAAGPTSFQLINTAREAGLLDGETALIYKMYAAFGDSRLPAEYRGDDGNVDDNPAIRELATAWPGLSDETKALLTPFLLTPPEPGSWFSTNAGSAFSREALSWDSILSSSLPVKVWYHPEREGDQAVAEAVISELEQQIWEPLTTLMQRAPLPDCGAACPSGGGDDRMDIYLVNENIRSYVMWNPPATPTCSNTASFMVLARNEPAEILAHELMHAIQFAFDVEDSCQASAWLAESTAEWVIDYVFPDSNHEHFTAAWMLDVPTTPLDFRDDQHEYGAYAFSFFAARGLNDPGLVRQFWELSEVHPTLKAVDLALGPHGGFESVWPQFALLNFNRFPIGDYRSWDGLNTGARYEDLGEISSDEALAGARIDYLGAHYYTASFGDAGYVRFTNPLPNVPHVKVQALALIDGQWQQAADWSDQESVSFCRNMPGQNLEELIIVISNSDWEGKQAAQFVDVPILEANGNPCSAWEGSVSGTVYYYQTRFTVEVEYVRFEPNPGVPPAGGREAYILVDASPVVWEVSGLWATGECTASGQMALDPPSSGTGKRARGSIGLDWSDDDYSGFIGGHDSNARFTLTCPEGGTSDRLWPVIPVMHTANSHPILDPDTHPHLTDSYHDPDPVYGGLWEWSLQPVP